MGEAIYVLCTLTSMACAILLIRGFGRSRVRILLWSSLCFVGLALNNLLLLIDIWLLPDVPLALARGVAALVGLAPLVFGLVWES